MLKCLLDLLHLPGQNGLPSGEELRRLGGAVLCREVWHFLAADVVDQADDAAERRVDAAERRVVLSAAACRRRRRGVGRHRVFLGAAVDGRLQLREGLGVGESVAPRGLEVRHFLAADVVDQADKLAVRRCAGRAGGLDVGQLFHPFDEEIPRRVPVVPGFEWRGGFTVGGVGRADGPGEGRRRAGLRHLGLLRGARVAVPEAGEIRGGLLQLREGLLEVVGLAVFGGGRPAAHGLVDRVEELVPLPRRCVLVRRRAGRHLGLLAGGAGRPRREEPAYLFCALRGLEVRALLPGVAVGRADGPGEG